MKRTYIMQAPAKINVGLWIKEKRKDGFHEIETLFQTISLADTVTIKEVSQRGIKIYCNNPEVPLDQTNLAYRAATVFLEHFEIDPQIAINIEKKIPVSAGLAGGSSNAATVLLLLSKMYDKALPTNDLMKLASTIGSDVPFLVRGGLAHAKGRGEQMNFYDSPRPSLYVAVVVPIGFKVSTRWAYENYTPGNNDVKARAFSSLLELYRRRELDSMRKLIFNDLETVTLHRHPEVMRIKELLASTLDGVVLMSGSGPSVFGLFDNKKAAMRAVQALHDEPVNVFIEQIIRRV